MTEFTADKFDAIIEGKRKPDRIIWTATGIGRRLNCTEDFVRKTLAHAPNTPIRKKGGRLYAFEDELMAWMREGEIGC